MKTSEAMIFAVVKAIIAIAYRSLKNSWLQRIWTRDLAIPVRRSNQLSYKATDVGSWSFVGEVAETSNPVKLMNFSGFSKQL